MKRFAFTMLELVFVIIVIGVLSVLAMPSFQTNILQRAAEQVASHIRYAQHLAIVDDKFDPGVEQYWRERWQFSMTGNSYTVYSDGNRNGSLDAGDADDESAVDPLTNVRIENIDLNDEYKVTQPDNVTIAFDHFGRPYTNLNSISGGLLGAGQTIVFTLTHDEGTATITVHPETGYVETNYAP